MSQRPERGLPGFESINRYWDAKHNKIAAKILPGEFYVTHNDEIIVTLLGSCISVCICDKFAQIGGMNHFMLPEKAEADMDKSRNIVGDAARYGNYAMEHMINEMLKYGADKRRMEVKVFGGAKVLRHVTNIGQNNVNFVLDYLDKENLSISAQDVGDVFPRKVIFYVHSGEVFLKKLRSLHNDTILERERSYQNSISTQPVSGDVELFD